MYVCVFVVAVSIGLCVHWIVQVRVSHVHMRWGLDRVCFGLCVHLWWYGCVLVMLCIVVYRVFWWWWEVYIWSGVGKRMCKWWQAMWFVEGMCWYLTEAYVAKVFLIKITTTWYDTKTKQHLFFFKKAHVFSSRKAHDRVMLWRFTLKCYM